MAANISTLVVVVLPQVLCVTIICISFYVRHQSKNRP